MKRGRTGTSSARKKTSKRKGDMALLKENAELRGRLEDIQEALRAVKAGEVDALFLDGQIYSLQGGRDPV